MQYRFLNLKKLMNFINILECLNMLETNKKKVVLGKVLRYFKTINNLSNIILIYMYDFQFSCVIVNNCKIAIENFILNFNS